MRVLSDDIIAVSPYVSINNLAGCIHFLKWPFFAGEFWLRLTATLKRLFFFPPNSEALMLAVRVYTRSPRHKPSPDSTLLWRRPTQPCSNLCGLQGRHPPGSHFLSSLSAQGLAVILVLPWVSAEVAPLGSGRGKMGKSGRRSRLREGENLFYIHNFLHYCCLHLCIQSWYVVEFV